jgi:signal transduction histidine kinase
MPDDTLDLLLIEDNPGDARFIREMLRDATELGERTLDRGRGEGVERPSDVGDRPLTVIHETRLASGLERLEEDDVDVVLLDLNLPDSEDLETLTAVRRVAETVPVIVLTGVRDRETGMEAFHRGADEYLVKDQISSDLLIRSIYHAVVHKRDERELKRQRDRLEAKTERLDEFAGIVAHDLRNPLSVAAGALELARETDDDEHLDRVEGALDRMSRLVDDLLTLARQGEQVEDPRPVRLESAARDAWTYVATNGGTLETDELSGSESVVADPDRLEQLLENLFGNAIEHGGPDVTVRVGLLDDGFYVEDTGPGVRPEDRSRVFEAGYTDDPSGTGFGLSIVRDIANAHDWTVTLEEGSDGGARFEFVDVERA